MIKPKPFSVEAMPSRLNILNYYLTGFPSPENKSFSEEEMIEIVLSMFPAIWINIIITAVLEPREESYEDLIEHLEKLESSLPDEPIPKKLKIKDDQETTSILKKIKQIKTTRPVL